MNVRKLFYSNKQPCSNVHCNKCICFHFQGTPSGEAFIQMDSEQSAEQAAVNKHKKFMFIGAKKRYIEVLQSSGEDMNLVLTTGVNALPSPAATPAAPAVLAATPQAPFPALNGLSRPLISPGMLYHVFQSSSLALNVVESVWRFFIDNICLSFQAVPCFHPPQPPPTRA